MVGMANGSSKACSQAILSNLKKVCTQGKYRAWDENVEQDYYDFTNIIKLEKEKKPTEYVIKFAGDQVQVGNSMAKQYADDDQQA